MGGTSKGKMGRAGDLLLKKKEGKKGGERGRKGRGREFLPKSR